jgi:hypothetical protein
LVLVAAVLAAVTSLTVADVIQASAATLNAVATIANPNTDAPLTSGGSTTVFTVTLPADAACSGDTATHGYHVYSYLVPSGTKLSKVKFVGNNPPSVGYGIVNNVGVYYGPVNTAIGTGQIVDIPANFEWGPLHSIDGVTVSKLLGVWDAGLACANSSGTLTDNWNTVVTFTANGSDPNGFIGTAGPPTITTTSLPPATIGTPYSTTVVVSGGEAPYKWKVSPKLPKGLKLNSKTGVISGTASSKDAPGTKTYTFTVTDATKATATASLALTVDAA